jgi:hypothetical protein
MQRLHLLGDRQATWLGTHVGDGMTADTVLHGIRTSMFGITLPCYSEIGKLRSLQINANAISSLRGSQFV